MTKRAAIYTRISNDHEGERGGVDRQEDDCRALAARLGLEPVAVYTENDVGASKLSRKKRPLYAEMMDRARAGEFDAIIAYSTSRLTRRPREFEDIVDLVESRDIAIHTVVSGTVDMTTADGQGQARNLANWDATEAARTGERVRRKFLENAREGKPHGRAAYGWDRVAGCDVVNDDQAAVIREAARRLLGGESSRAITRDLNDRGIPSPRGGAWDGVILRQIMLRERNAGRRIHQGKVIGAGAWEPILDDDIHDRLVAQLRDPSRVTTRGTPVRYLLSGIAECGLCGGRMRVSSGGGRQAPAYACSECYRVRRKVEFVEAVVNGVVVARLTAPDGPDLFGGDKAAQRALDDRAQALKARLDIAADQYADGNITGAQLARISAKLQPQIADVERRARAAAPQPQMAEFAGKFAATAWEQASVEVRRSVVRMLMRVTILPSGPGRSFDPESVQIEWLGAGAHQPPPRGGTTTSAP